MKKLTFIGIIGMKADQSIIELSVGAPRNILSEELIIPFLENALKEHKYEVKDCIAYKCEGFCVGIKDEALLKVEENSEECKEFMKKFLENPESVEDKLDDSIEGPAIYIGKVVGSKVEFTSMDFKLDLDI